MGPSLRSTALVAHIVVSVGLIGAVAVFFVLAAVGLSSADARLAQAAYAANDVIALLVILPSTAAALATGLLMSLGTPWGLFRHYWVLVKLVLTVFVVVVLLLQMDGIGHVADQAGSGEVAAAELQGLKRSFVVHAGGGLLVLLLITALSVWKPRGLTRHGWRKRKLSERSAE